MDHPLCARHLLDAGLQEQNGQKLPALLSFQSGCGKHTVILAVRGACGGANQGRSEQPLEESGHGRRSVQTPGGARPRARQRASSPRKNEPGVSQEHPAPPGWERHARGGACRRGGPEEARREHSTRGCSPVLKTWAFFGELWPEQPWEPWGHSLELDGGKGASWKSDKRL